MRRSNVIWLLLMLLPLTAQASYALATPEQHTLPRTGVRSTQTITTPDKAAIALSQHWREQLLKDGGAGLYQSLDLALLGKQAGLSTLETSLLPRLQAVFAGDKPVRVRVYWVVTQQTWVARLDFADQGVNFLKLDTQGGKLVDWYDYSLGTSLSQLLAAAAKLSQQQLSVFLDGLEQAPMDALRLLPDSNPLTRLALAACLSHDCYEQALAQLPLGAQERSLFGLEKAMAAGDFQQADAQMQALQQSLGEDPAVVWLGAGVAMSEQHWQAALALVLPAIQRWPSEPRLYPIASQCYMELKQPQQALAMLRQLQDKAGTPVDWASLVQTPLYAPLAPELRQAGLIP